MSEGIACANCRYCLEGFGGPDWCSHPKHRHLFNRRRLKTCYQFNGHGDCSRWKEMFPQMPPQPETPFRICTQCAHYRFTSPGGFSMSLAAQHFCSHPKHLSPITGVNAHCEKHNSDGKCVKWEEK